MRKNIKWVVIAIVALIVVGTATVVPACLYTLVYPRYSVGVLPDETDLQNAVAYQRVLIFGVDGAGNYFKDIDTPNFDRVFGGGSVNYNGMSQYPTTSAHNWTSIFHGVRYQKHHIDNSVAAKRKYTQTEYPSVFKVCADLYPTAKMISLTGWFPLNNGVIEDLENLIKYNGPEDHKKDDPLLTKADIEMKDAFIGELRGGLDPKIAFMYFAQVDEYGHNGGRNADFYQAMRLVDGYIGEVYDEYVAAGLAEDTLFVFVTDHGHRALGGHGGNSKSERTVTIAVAGKKGNIIAGTPGKTVTQDVASIVLYGLGIRQPDSWESRVPYGIFNTLPNSDV